MLFQLSVFIHEQRVGPAIPAQSKRPADVVGRVFVQRLPRPAGPTPAWVDHNNLSWWGSGFSSNSSAFSCGQSGQYRFPLLMFGPAGIASRFQGTCNPQTIGLTSGTMWSTCSPGRRLLYISLICRRCSGVNHGGDARRTFRQCSFTQYRATVSPPSTCQYSQPLPAGRLQRRET